MYRIVYASRMKRDMKRVRKRGKDLSKLVNVLSILSSGQPLPTLFHDHQLSGELRDFRECHIEPDWLLMYRIQEDRLILTATAAGTHADLFGL